MDSQRQPCRHTHRQTRAAVTLPGSSRSAAQQVLPLLSQAYTPRLYHRYMCTCVLNHNALTLDVFCNSEMFIMYGMYLYNITWHVRLGLVSF